MAHDVGRGRTVMFGGQGAGGVLDDTWEWDGVDWHATAPAVRPAGRLDHCMAHDLLRGVTVMFGGTTNPILPRTRTDTWEWNGVNWVAIATANAPSEGEQCAMCFDIPRGVCVLAGGTSFFGAPDQSTWEYDGVDWTNVTATVGPGPTATPGLGIAGARMVFDPRRSVSVLHGGRTPNGTFPTDTWEYDGAAWRIASTGSPASRTRFALAMDEVRGVVVMQGGVNGSFQTFFNETWQFTGARPASYTTFGAGCAGGNGVPTNTASALPRIGRTMSIDLGNLPGQSVAMLVIGLSNSQAPFGPLPVDLGIAGAPGCLLRVSNDAIAFLFGSGGTASFALALPNRPALVGAVFHTQGLALDPPANALGAVTTDAATAVVGG